MKADYMDSLNLCEPGVSYMGEADGVYVSPCIYCGFPANSIDHVPPRHMRLQLSACALIAIHEREVPACRECNSVLGARPLLTILERRNYIKQALRRRYAKYLRIPNWTEEKLAELGEELRGMIKRNMAVRDDTRKRLQWKGGYYEKRNDVPMVQGEISCKSPKMAKVLLPEVPMGEVVKRESPRKATISEKRSIKKFNKVCEYCLEVFHVEGRGTQRRFCSQICRDASWNITHMQPNNGCEHCGKVFNKVSLVGQLFCSSRCFDESWKVRHDRIVGL